MTFKKWHAKEYIKSKSLDSLRLEIRATAAWNASKEESAKTAENIKSSKFTKSWNEACDEIAKEIRRSK